MPSDYDDHLLRQAIINIKARDYSLARHYLELAIALADDIGTRTQANYWMSQICSDPGEKRKYLEETLANDPVHAEARKALAILDGRIQPGELVDPDNPPVQEAGTVSVQADRFTCPKCGGRMVFDGDGRTLVCEYCSRGQVLSPAVPRFEQDFVTAMATGRGHRTPVNLKTFNCQGCGARFIFSPGQISDLCAYCGSPHVVEMTRELVEPDSIIPMAINQDQATSCLADWLKKHRLLPRAEPQIPRGLYLPVWSFDMLGTVPWNGTVYRNKQRVPVSGEQNVSFDDPLIPAVHRLSDLLPKILPGFVTSSAPAYDPRYLAGWPAEVYELAMSDASLQAREQAVGRIRARIRADHGGVDDLYYSTAGLSILSFKLVLIPLWHASYSLDGRDFRAIINGQSGKVYAEMRKPGVFGWLENILGE